MGNGQAFLRCGIHVVMTGLGRVFPIDGGTALHRNGMAGHDGDDGEGTGPCARVTSRRREPGAMPLRGSAAASAARVRQLRASFGPVGSSGFRVPLRGPGMTGWDLTRHARPRAGHPRLGGATAPKTWMAGTSPAMTGWYTCPCLCLCMSKSQHLGARSLRCEPCGGSRVARVAARLDCYVLMEEPDGRFAHGSFRRLDLDQRRAAKGLLAPAA